MYQQLLEARIKWVEPVQLPLPGFPQPPLAVEAEEDHEIPDCYFALPARRARDDSQPLLPFAKGTLLNAHESIAGIVNDNFSLTLRSWRDSAEDYLMVYPYTSIPRNHASRPTPASRPVLTGRCQRPLTHLVFD